MLPIKAQVEEHPMVNTINEFGSILARTPAPAEELIRNGAYPYVTGPRDFGDIPVELIRPVIGAYFERSEYFSPDAAISPRFDSMPGYFLTGEWNYSAVLEKIMNAGDVYVGVSRALGSTFPAWAGSEHSFSVDVDPTVPFGFLPVYSVLLAMSPSRVHFASFVLGRPLRKYPSERFEEMTGEQIIKWVEARSYNGAYSLTMRKAIASLIGEVTDVEGAGNAAEVVMDAFLSRPGELHKLAETDRSGRGGLLSSEAAYRRERDLFLQGRITGVFADLATTEINPLLKVLKAMKLSIGLLYLSNVEEWIFEGLHLGEDKERAWKFYKNLAALQKISDGQPLIISAIDYLNPLVFGLSEYINMSIPLGAGRDWAVRLAFEYFQLRQNIMRDQAMRNDGPAVLLDVAGAHVGGVPARLLRDARRIIKDAAMNEGDFHRAMFSSSDTYKNSTRSEQRMFRLNMIALGVVTREPEETGTAGATIITGMTPAEEVSRPAAGRGGYLSAGGRSQFPVEFMPPMPAAVLPGTVPMTVSMAPVTNMIMGSMMTSGTTLPF
jgi:hypothetical protein